MIYTIPITKNEVQHTNIKRSIFQKPKFGCESMFIQLTKKQGIKIFPKKKDACFSRNLQKLAYKKGFAPAVYSGIKICTLKNLYRFNDEGLFLRKDGKPFVNDEKLYKYGYFYITEVAKMAKIKSAKQWRQMNKLKDLVKAISYKNIYYDDIHEDNIGILHGKMVIIDFGPESVSIK